MEIWRPIKEFEGCYEISNLGRIKSLERIDKMNRVVKEKIRKYKINRNGYCQVCLNKNGIKNYFYVHRLVAKTFIPNFKNKSQVNHKNFDKEDNRVENLEWVTCTENNKHKIIGGRVNYKKIVETKRKKGNLNWHTKGINNSCCKKIKCLNNGKIYNYIKKASSELNLDSSSISKVCRGKRKHIKGYVFEYL